MDTLLEAFCSLAVQDLAPPFGTPDDRVHDEVDALLFMVLVNGASVHGLSTTCKRLSHSSPL
jgi:hypothetical protein